MAVPHWTHDGFGAYGCQATACGKPAVHQWSRNATETEIAAEMNLQGPFGEVHRNPQGPHVVAVFVCEDHMMPIEKMVFCHREYCPAPDEGCECDVPTG